MQNEIHDKVEAQVYFLQHRPWIKSFIWKNTKYPVSSMNLVTRARKGQSPVFLFSVSNDKGAYDLRFDTDTLNWYLEKVYWK